MAKRTFTHEEIVRRREYQRKYAADKRRARLDAANADSMRCSGMLFHGVRCNERLQNRFVDGQTVPFCPRHDKKQRGICVDCDLPVDGKPGKALYCPYHRKLAHIAAYARNRKKHRAKYRKKERLRMADPVARQDRLAYKKLYRQSKPQKVAQYKRDYAKRNAEKVAAYHLRYRSERRELNRERERLRNAGLLPPRSCLTCETVVTGRAKRCDECKRNSRTQSRAAIAARLERAA